MIYFTVGYFGDKVEIIRSKSKTGVKFLNCRDTMHRVSTALPHIIEKIYHPSNLPDCLQYISKSVETIRRF